MNRLSCLAAIISIIVPTLIACGSDSGSVEEAVPAAQPAAVGTPAHRAGTFLTPASLSPADISRNIYGAETTTQPATSPVAQTQPTPGPELSATPVAPAVVKSTADPTAEVVFPDPKVEETVRLEIRKPKGPILVADVEPLTELGLSWQLQISDLTGLDHLVNLTKLDLQNNQISDLSPIASLTNLTWLHVKYNEMVDVSPLASLTNLSWLNLQDNQISDLSPLVSLTNLSELNIQKNAISDISPLASLTNLTNLNLTNNQVSDLSPLASLSNLTKLNLSKNAVTDISPLLEAGLGEGVTVTLWGNTLDAESVDVVIPQLAEAGVKVQY